MLTLFLSAAVALRISGAALRAHDRQLPAQGIAWFLCLLAGWLVAMAFGAWSPLWLVLALAVVASLIGHRYNSDALWFIGDFIAIIVYGLFSQLSVNLITLIGVTMMVSTIGLLLDRLFGKLPGRVALIAFGAPLVTFMFLGLMKPTMSESSIRLLQSRLFVPPSLATLTLPNKEPVGTEAGCTQTSVPVSSVRSQAGDTSSQAGAIGNVENNPTSAAPQATVGQWEVYEITLTSTKTYVNPFRDVDVYADFTAADGSTIRVYGFYDGNGNGNQGNLWKIRFASDITTSWSWHTTATDTSNSGLHDQSGQFNVVSSDEPGPLAPDPQHPNAWQHANGTHFLWSLGYSIHMLGADRTHPAVGGWEDYLDWLQAHRFNGVMFIMQVPSFDACSTCQAGMAPWSALGNNPPPTYAFNNNNRVDYFVMPWAREGDPNTYGETLRNTDFNRFYLPLWQKADEILAEMQERDMVAHIFQYDDQTFWPTAGSPEEELYWDYMIRRFGAHWNVAFNDGIDLNEYRPSSWVSLWQEYFCENDPFQHARSSRHGSDEPNSATWRSMQAANASQPNNVDAWRNLMDDSPQKPVTEDDGIRAEKDHGIPADRFMQLAWWSVLSGPGGFGATWAGANDPGNWYANLDEDSEGMLRVEIRNRFVLDFNVAQERRIPFWKLEVHDDLVSEKDVYVVADPGDHYLVYFDEGAPRNISLDLSAASTNLPVTWLNPVTGQRTSAEPVVPGDARPFSNPYNGPGVLYVGAGETDGAGEPPPVVDCTDEEACHFLPIMRTNN